MLFRLALIAGTMPLLAACDSGASRDSAVSFAFARPDTVDLEYDSPRSLLAADFDGDGDDDLLIVHANDVGLTLLRNNGGARFDEVPQPFLDFTGPWQTSLADLDNDGDLDLAVATSLSTGEFLLFRNDGTGLFSLATLYPGADGAFLGSVPGDFDGDGDIDLAAVSDDGSWMLVNDGTGGFQSAALQADHRLSANLLQAADMDGGGTVDILTEGDDPVGLLQLSNDGGARFTSAHMPALSVIRGGVIADVDGDGHRDVVVVWSGGLARYAGVSNGLAPHQPFSSVNAADLHRADFDGDGLDEVAAWEGGVHGRIAMYAWDGVGPALSGAVAVPDFLVAGHADVFAVGDFDGDGWDDLAVSILEDYTRPRVLVYLNVGPGV